MLAHEGDCGRAANRRAVARLPGATAVRHPAGNAPGASAALMKPIVANLTGEPIVAIAAYVADDKPDLRPLINTRSA
jgi:hypothetical protein